jgi:CBS domain-containing protein
MVTAVITIDPEAPIKEAAKRMVENRIGALPAVDKSGKMVGIITESDILRAFVAGKQ